MPTERDQERPSQKVFSTSGRRRRLDESPKRETLGMDNEVAKLRAVLEACHRILPQLYYRDDRTARAIRETCSAIEERLQELGEDVSSSAQTS